MAAEKDNNIVEEGERKCDKMTYAEQRRIQTSPRFGPVLSNIASITRAVSQPVKGLLNANLFAVSLLTPIYPCRDHAF
jgi:hypothetical protein